MGRRKTGKGKKGSGKYVLKHGRTVMGSFRVIRNDLFPILFIGKRIGEDMTKITNYSKIFRKALWVAGLVAQWDALTAEQVAITTLEGFRTTLRKGLRESEILGMSALTASNLFLVGLMYEMDGDERRKKVFELVSSFLEILRTYNPRSERPLSNEERDRIAALVDEAFDVLVPEERAREALKD